ncbi:26S proteasome regulatory subunit, ATPase 3, interacting protein [Nematocida displodere]|uniref:26S proteasome regulatory subunit, ATPase 3, interacting protein n=1 Tax=Nematocida displodere TaxID=1805483 RepID=A0A177EF14_9MICR|nr:26S proteasome regulatory subunit, ATPase 3, interacting protein [Nematocida displodere]
MVAREKKQKVDVKALAARKTPRKAAQPSRPATKKGKLQPAAEKMEAENDHDQDYEVDQDYDHEADHEVGQDHEADHEVDQESDQEEDPETNPETPTTRTRRQAVTAKPATLAKTAKPSVRAPTNVDEQLILNYLIENNKPTNATEVGLQLQTKLQKKTASIKILADLALKGQIIEKVSGKSRIYSPLPKVVDPEEDNEASQKLIELEEECAVVKEESERLASTYKGLVNEPTNTELSSKHSLTSEELAAKLEKLSEFKTSYKAPINPEEKDKIIAKTILYQKEEKRRRRIFNDIVAQVMEGAGLTKAELFSASGIENVPQ